MNIYTDASLNDMEKIAGIGCVCVFNPKNDNNAGISNNGGGGVNLEHTTYPDSLPLNSIHVAELCALVQAIELGRKSNASTVHVVSDSVSALNMLAKYVECTRLREERLSSKQKKFLNDLSNKPVQYFLLERMLMMFKSSKQHFIFAHTPGHQKKAAIGTAGYWNNIADIVAQEGRLQGEKKKALGIKLDINSVFPPLEEEPEISGWRSRVHAGYIVPKPKVKGPEKISSHSKKMKEKEEFHVRLVQYVKVRF